MHQNSETQHTAVLVVDDEVLIRMHAAGTLEESGFEVLEAADAREALQVLENRPDIRLIFTDIQMPGKLDGLDLIREVHRRWPKILLVVTSARVKPRDSEIADSGTFLAKPYSEKQLITEVTEAIKKG